MTNIVKDRGLSRSRCKLCYTHDICCIGFDGILVYKGTSLQMIHVAHRGLGGMYSSYAREAAKRISRIRPTTISNVASSRPSYRVAISVTGEAASEAVFDEILNHPSLTIFVGDSNGLPDVIIKGVDRVVSLTALPITHQVEVCALMDILEARIKKK